MKGEGGPQEGQLGGLGEAGRECGGAGSSRGMLNSGVFLFAASRSKPAPFPGVDMALFLDGLLQTHP